MSEEALNEEVIAPEVEEPIVEEATVDPSEQMAREGGWKPADEWEDDDPKKPDQLVSAEVFNVRGEFIGRLKSQDKRMSDMQSSFDNANKFRDKQTKIEKASLQRQLDEAISLADVDGAKRIQGDIDELNTQPEPEQSAPEQAVVDSWNQSNPWINQNSPKSAYAKSQFAAYEAQGMDVGAILASVDMDMTREFPPVTKTNAARVEGGSKAGGGRKTSAKLSMADLNQGEKDTWRLMSDSWDSQEEFLKSAQKIRDEESK